MKKKNITILNVEDEEVDHIALCRILNKRRIPYDVKRASSMEDAYRQLSESEIDIVLIDYHLASENDGLELLQEIGDEPPSIVLTGRGDETVAVEAMKAGAYDYIVKDADGRYLDLIPYAIDHALEKHKDKLRFNRYVAEIKRMNQLMVGRELRMGELKNEIEQLKKKIKELELQKIKPESASLMN